MRSGIRQRRLSHAHIFGLAPQIVPWIPARPLAAMGDERVAPVNLGEKRTPVAYRP